MRLLLTTRVSALRFHSPLSSSSVRVPIEYAPREGDVVTRLEQHHRPVLVRLPLTIEKHFEKVTYTRVRLIENTSSCIVQREALNMFRTFPIVER